ncbi:FecCD family ABC transporter permease [Acidomonas methanolica]|uniref:ABC transporter ferrichrome Fe3+-siderophore transporter n=1 Tax=Acidomonas methanolica NBRC 104435 TaxID=1231351 RepID=A0A023D8U5_ACIMT|nr:iron ABC transporter permease [Acidomonas methanolica]MBU2655225.1 iron ABC transporter permease [Acidomonas methanolica]TCS25604.1 iron complex transport system permease protein [Acidomonas methanolica]GAJ30155.1 ABC transporter ferrichrome Fe3+-siderophore transporter [Acidomonas methanolica NBRC 104435]GBQ56998.1 ferrichrome ABC transporter permease [Acidomonas methanolica]GEK98729.1 ABC transporter permease [Acidomonas methanolica NBRC 104435]
MKHPALWLALLVALLFMLVVAQGESGINAARGLADLLAGRDSVEATILGQLRLPRAILAVLVGGVLGLSGAALQGYLRNPLADPALLGISGGAALGAVCIFYMGIARISVLLLPLGGLAGAMLAVVLLMLLVGRGGAFVLLLAGAALTSLFAALTALTLNLVKSPFASFEVAHWLMGSLADRGFASVALCLPGIVAGSLLMAGTGRALDALALGDEVAESMGFVLRGWSGVQARLVLGVALAVGSCTAVCGAIGFVGLVVPHVLRGWVGYRPAALLWPSCLGGAAMLLLADWAVRMLSGGTELQIGVLTAITGAPVFLWRVLRLRREGE